MLVTLLEQTAGNSVNTEILKNLPDWIIVGLTGLSFILSVGGFIIAILSYKMSKRNDIKSNPRIDLYLVNGNILINGDERIYIFDISISNLSTTANSIKSISMKVSYTHEGRKYQKHYYHDNSLFKKYLLNNEFTIPVHLEQGKSIIVNPVFKVDNRFKKEIEIDYYTIIFEDNYNMKYEIDITLVCEVSMDEYLEKKQIGFEWEW